MSSVWYKAVSGEWLLPVPPQFPSLISTQEESDEISPYQTLSEGEYCGVYDRFQYKQEVCGEVDGENGVWVDFVVGEETA